MFNENCSCFVEEVFDFVCVNEVGVGFFFGLVFEVRDCCEFEVLSEGFVFLYGVLVFFYYGGCWYFYCGDFLFLCGGWDD